MNLFVGKNSFCYTESVVLSFKTAGWQDSVFVTPVLEGKYNIAICAIKAICVFVTPVLEGKYNINVSFPVIAAVFVTPVLEGKYNFKVHVDFSKRFSSPPFWRVRMTLYKAAFLFGKAAFVYVSGFW